MHVFSPKTTERVRVLNLLEVGTQKFVHKEEGMVMVMRGRGGW